jgi:hypothetical protein
MGDLPAIQTDESDADDDDLHDVADEEEGSSELTGTEAWNEKVGRKRPTKHCRDLKTKDHKPPENEEMHPAGRLFPDHEFLLAKGKNKNSFDSPAKVVKSIRGLTGAQDLESNAQGTHEESQADDCN